MTLTPLTACAACGLRYGSCRCTIGDLAAVAIVVDRFGLDGLARIEKLATLTAAEAAIEEAHGR